jgi:hypothetical protein
VFPPPLPSRSLFLRLPPCSPFYFFTGLKFPQALSLLQDLPPSEGSPRVARARERPSSARPQLALSPGSRGPLHSFFRPDLRCVFTLSHFHHLLASSDASLLLCLGWGNAMQETLFNAHLACFLLILQARPQCTEDRFIEVKEYLGQIFDFWCVNPTSLFSE